MADRLNLKRAEGDHALANRLRQVRRDAGLTVEQAAGALGLAVADLHELEAGLWHIPASTLVRAAKTYHAAPSSMLPREADWRLGRTVAELDASEDGHGTAGARRR